MVGVRRDLSASLRLKTAQTVKPELETIIPVLGRLSITERTRTWGAFVSASFFDLPNTRRPITLTVTQHRYSYATYLPPVTMSNTSGSHLQSLFDAALEDYEKQTGMKLIDHPLARQLENCHSVDAIMDVLQQQAHAFTEFRGEDGKVKKSLKRAVHILHVLSTSTTLGEGVGLVRRMAFLTTSSS